MSRATGVDIFGTILAATDPHQLFGDSEVNGRLVYKRLARRVHPDQCSDPRAEETFKQLEHLWAMMSAPARAQMITSKRHEYELGERIAVGDVGTLFHVTWDARHRRGVMKIAGNPKDRDLITAEVSALRALDSVPEQYREFHPHLVDAFRLRDRAAGVDRAVVVTNYLRGFYSLAEVREQYPDLVDWRTCAWIFRRLLVALDTAHDVGLVHGAVVPEHVMIHPQQHGLTLVGWAHSVKIGSPLISAPPAYVDWLSADARAKKPVDHRHDLSLAAKTMLAITGDNCPKSLRAFFNGCMISSVPTAGELLGEFDALLDERYGRRRFHPFAMPSPRKEP